jgi:tRNA threonylcarbamoyladenosine biosynthesis protein TsaE
MSGMRDAAEDVSILTRSAAETRAVGLGIGALLRPGDVVVLSGDLGAGKTVFAKGVAEALGVDEPVVSPTFAILREYEGRVPMVHVDVYRLDRLQELHDVGLDDLLGGAAVAVVEWGDRVQGLLPADRLHVHIASGDDLAEDERRVVVRASGASWQGRASALATSLSSGGRAAPSGDPAVPEV